MTGKRHMKPTPGAILKIVETDSRDVIKEGSRSIAYIAIGAEAYAPLLAHAPQLLEVAQRYVRECMTCAGVGIDPENHDCEDCSDVRLVIAQATGGQSG